MHGSQVDGKVHPKSDMDIAFMQEKTHKEINLLDLIFDLSTYFKTNKLDLVNLTHANPLLLQAVLTKSKLLSGSTSDYDKLSLLAFHKYSDYFPYFEMEANFIKEKISRYA
jgi:predicted nucleotidyltransferase